MAYVFLFQSAKNRIYEQNIHAYTLSGTENSPFQFCLTIEKIVLSVVSQGNY